MRNDAEDQGRIGFYGGTPVTQRMADDSADLCEAIVEEDRTTDNERSTVLQSSGR